MILARIATVVAVSSATWLATTSLMAKPPKRAPAAVITPPTVSMRAGPLAAPVAARPIQLGTSGAYAEGHLRSHKVQIVDGIATVDAHVSLADSRPGVSFIWRLRTVDDGERPTNSRLYDHQIFAMQANGQREVDFHDQIEVPAGTHRVELVLYEIIAARGMGFLDDDQAAKGAELIRIAHLPRR